MIYFFLYFYKIESIIRIINKNKNANPNSFYDFEK